VAAVRTSGGALQGYRQSTGGFAEDDFGEGPAAVALRQGGGVASDVGGDRQLGRVGGL
jgi:hypothetical protein